LKADKIKNFMFKISKLKDKLKKHKKLILFISALIFSLILDIYPMSKLGGPNVDHSKLSDKVLCVLLLHSINSLLICSTATLTYTLFQALSIVQNIDKHWKLKKAKGRLPVPLINLRNLTLAIIIHAFFLFSLYFTIKNENILVPEFPYTIPSVAFAIITFFILLITVIAVPTLLGVYALDLYLLTKRGELSLEVLGVPSLLLRTLTKPFSEGIPIKLLSKAFLKCIFAVCIAIQAIINSFFAAKSSEIERSWNPQAKVFYSTPQDTQKEILEYLLEIKHEFNISEKEQEGALNKFKERLKNAKEIKVYVIDDFNEEIPTVAFLYGIPVVATFKHGTVVEKILQSLTKDSKVQIITKKYEILNRNIQKNMKFPPIFESKLMNLLKQIEQEPGAVLVNMSFGSTTKNTGDFVGNLIYIKKLIELNNKGIVIFASAGNRHNPSVIDVDLNKAVAFLLSNYYVVGDPKGLQYGEINVKGTAYIRYRNGVLAKVRGTSFSSPTALGLFIQEASKELKPN